MSHRDKISFALQGSLIDLITGAIPNFSRSSSLWLEKYLIDDLRLKIVDSHHPAMTEDGSIYLEAASLNEATWNTDLARNDWIKGTNIAVRPDEALVPTRRFYGDRLAFSGSKDEVASKQTMTREFFLDPHTEYTLSVIVKKWAGEFSTADEIRLTGPGNSQAIALSQLNKYPKKYRILETSLTTNGTENIKNLQGLEFEIIAISGNDYQLNLTTTATFSLTLDELKSSRLFVTGKGLFEITGNTLKTDTDTNFFITLQNIVSGNSPSVNDIAGIFDSDRLSFKMEIFCESNTTFDWGGFKLEPVSFRTSPNFQFQEAKSSASSSLVYRVSPLSNLSDVGVLATVNFWRGKANLFKTSNFSMGLELDKLNVDVGGVSVQLEVKPGFTVFAQVIANTNTLKIYLDGKLVSQSSLSGFVGTLGSNLDLSQDMGVISLKKLIFFDDSFTDGNVFLQGDADLEVKEIFDDETLVAASQINNSVTHMHLPQVLIPAANAPTASAYIQAVKNVTKTIQVGNLRNFALGDVVYVVRYYNDSPTVILDTVIVNIDDTNNLVRLANIDGVRAEDYLLKGAISTPGSASVRFNFFPIDNQSIQAIFPGSSELQLSSTTAFTPGRTFIYDVDYRDVSEVNVTSVDLANKRITVSSLDDIKVGYVVAQPGFETLISPANYFVEFQQDIDRVLVEAKYTNGIVLKNFNTFPVRVSPQIKIAL